MPRRLPRPARLALGVTKAGLVASMVAAGLLSPPVTSTGPGYADFPVQGASDSPTRESRLLERHDCSPTGFADATPLSAVVRTAHGRLQHVSFDAGWEVYTQHGKAQLVAVCLGDAPAQP